MTAPDRFESSPNVDSDLSIQELKRILSLQGEMLKRVVTRNDYSCLLDELCELAESFTSNAVAVVMLYSPERDALFVESGPSLTSESIAVVNGLRPGQGSCGNAVFHDAPMYVANTMQDARWETVRDVATNLGIESCFSFPIRDKSGMAIGSFSISSFEPRTVDGFHQVLLDTCANICSVICQRRADEQVRNRLLEERIQADRVESVATLAGGIAHDFNNLLTAISGNVELTAATLGDDQAKENLNLAMKAVRRASKVTKQLRSVAHGGSPFLRPSDVGAIIRDSSELALRGSNCSFDILGLETLKDPIIKLDSGQIGQLIQSLVMNARQAMPDGGVVRIECKEVSYQKHPQLADGAYIQISVSDSGQGMSQEDAEHIFEPYSARDQQNGWGMYLCRLIVQRHGGLISVETAIGKGSRVTIDLPQEKCEVASAEVDCPSIAGTNVLLMDDNHLVRRTLNGMLRRLGCNVWEATDGAEAVKCYVQQAEEGNPIDVTILDLTVPGGMGGLRARDELRRFDPAAKIVASSGYSVSEPLDCDQETGFDASMPKPYDLDDLRSVLAKLAENLKA